MIFFSGFFDHVKSSFHEDFLSPDGYFFAGWFLLYVLVGFFMSYRAGRKEGKSFSFREALNYCFPFRSYWSVSAKLDYKIILLSHYVLLYPLGLFMITGQGRMARLVAPYIVKGLTSAGPLHIPLSNGFWVEFIYTALILMAADLGWTIQHILFHKVPWLWRIHKVHHSATELNVFTIARIHPLDFLTQTWGAGLFIGLFAGLTHALLGYTPSLVTILNASWAMSFFRILGIFRHSHMWISYGPHLSCFVSSPAMHQIHHSSDPKHFDKNFCVVFSFWDYLFGTLYIPREKEDLKFGSGPESHPARKYESFFEVLIFPLLPDRALNRFSRYRGEEPS